MITIVLEKLQSKGNDGSYMVGVSKNKGVLARNSNIKEITGEKIGQNIWTCLFHDYNPKETIHENNNLKTPECCKGSDPQKMVK